MPDNNRTPRKKIGKSIVQFALYTLIPALAGVGLSAFLSLFGVTGTALQGGLVVLSVLFGVFIGFSSASAGLREYGLLIAFASASFAIGVGVTAYVGLGWTAIMASLAGSQLLFWAVMLVFLGLARRQRRP